MFVVFINTASIGITINDPDHKLSLAFLLLYILLYHSFRDHNVMKDIALLFSSALRRSVPAVSVMAIGVFSDPDAIIAETLMYVGVW